MTKPKGLIYLASPYSDESEFVRTYRFVAACKAVASLIRRGLQAFSPIVHGHSIALYTSMDGSWDTWAKLDKTMLRRSDTLVVLMIDGYRESRGVNAEIRLARKQGKPIFYIDEDGKMSGDQHVAIESWNRRAGEKGEDREQSKT